MKFLHALCNIILFILFTVCFCLTGYVYAMRFANEYFNRGEIVVPDITMMPHTEAARILPEEFNLSMKVAEEIFDKNIPRDCIISQNPLPNTSVKPGRVIEVVVSKGQKKIEIINTIDEDSRAAELNLKKCGFLVGMKTYMYSDDVPYGFVIAQYPAPFSQVEEGITVNLLVSMGKSEYSLVMPDFTGKKYTETRDTILKSGFKTGKIGYENLSEYPSDTIIKQLPVPGMIVRENAEIDLVVNGMQGDGRNYSKVVFPVPDGKLSYQVKIIVVDEKGIREIYRKEHNPGEIAERQFGYYGHAKVMIYLDNMKHTEMEY